MHPMDDRVEGVVERITYQNAENGYTVLRLRPRGSVRHLQRDGLVTVVGNLPTTSAGESLLLGGEWRNHPKHGMQFHAVEARQVLPATIEGIRRYLGSGLIKGVGPRTAERIVEAFGEETLDVIEAHPERLQSLRGIGREKAFNIHQQWLLQRAIQDVMIFLQGHGITTGLAVKVFKQYGNDSIRIVQQDPYQLAQDIWGVGFKTADQLAQKLGLPGDAPSRLQAGLVYALETLVGEGHVYCPEGDLFERTRQLLDAPDIDLEAALSALQTADRVAVEPLDVDANGDERAVYLTPFYWAEVGVARRLAALLEKPASRLAALQGRRVDELLAAAESNVDLTETQLQALAQAVRHKVSIITGGPGTGKTTALRTLVSVLTARGFKVELASPTGRAARRLAEASKHPANTIHKLLGYQPPNDFSVNEDNPLRCDMLIVDEASMVDLLLMNNLLKALPAEAHLVLVGDADQLPSVGAGDVLRDLIASGKVPTTRLNLIFRQQAGSYIVSNAHRVNEGQQPLIEKDAEDFFHFEFDGPDEVADWVVDVVRNRVPRRFGLDPVRDIQVLAPMYRGAAGVNALNERLQAALNPEGRGQPERRVGQRLFRVGDKVMQLRNNYEKDVFNGDIGYVRALDGESQTLSVVFEGDNYVNYEWSECDELTHAYAVSVHKSQGSEYPAVVLPLVTQHYMMLQRNLLYTAITRAKRLVVLVGSKKALGMAVRNAAVNERFTRLVDRLNAPA